MPDQALLSANGGILCAVDRAVPSIPSGYGGKMDSSVQHDCGPCGFVPHVPCRSAHGFKGVYYVLRISGDDLAEVGIPGYYDPADG